VKDPRRRHRAPAQPAEPRERRGAGRARIWRLLIAAVLILLPLSLAGVWWSRGARAPADPMRPTGQQAAAPSAAPGQPSPPALPALPELKPDAPVPTTVAGLIDEAQRVVGVLAQRFPDDPYALDCVAKAHFYLGNTGQAAEHWSRCLELDPRAAFAHEGLGRVADLNSRYEEAATHFQKAVELSPSLADTRWLSDTVSQLAQTLMKLGQLPAARQALEQHLRDGPPSAKNHLLLGQLLLQMREYEPAAASFQASIRIQSNQPEAHFGLATALKRTGRDTESAAAMEEFQKLREHKSKARTRMKFQEAEPLELAGKVATTYAHAGQAYMQHGDAQVGEQHWRRATRLSPTHVDARAFLATYYLQSGRPADALQASEELAAIEPANPMHHWRLAMLHRRLGQFEPAEAALRTVITLSPERAEGYAALADLYLQSVRRPDAARPLAQQAVQLEPTAEHYALLSRVCAQLGDQDAALDAAQQAQQLQKKAPQ